MLDDSYDDEPFLYMDSRPSKYRPSRLLQNKDTFYRVSRAHEDSFAPLLDEIDTEFEDFNDEFARPTRSQDKNDNFVRFGRGNSNFVRFGRDSYKHKNQDFVRFGRSISESEIPKKRSRRDVDESKKRNDRDNFLRFGRGGGDDSFIRYGRNPDGIKINADETLPVPTKSNFIHGQSAHYPIAINGRLLHSSPLFSILRKIEEEMRQSN